MHEPARQPSVVILISGTGTNMLTIAKQALSGEIPCKISAVISNRPAAHGLVSAKELGIETAYVDHTNYPQRELFDAALIRAIDQHEPDLVILAGFMRILTNDFVNRYQGRLINIHPSLLPKYPGLNTHQRAIDAGDKVHGVTTHFVTPELDGGPNIIQAQVPILEKDSADTLATRVQAQEHVIYPITVKWFVQGRLTHDERNVYLDGEVLPETGLILDSPNTLH